MKTAQHLLDQLIILNGHAVSFNEREVMQSTIDDAYEQNILVECYPMTTLSNGDVTLLDGGHEEDTEMTHYDFMVRSDEENREDSIHFLELDDVAIDDKDDVVLLLNAVFNETVEIIGDES